MEEDEVNDDEAATADCFMTEPAAKRRRRTGKAEQEEEYTREMKQGPRSIQHGRHVQTTKRQV
jgi:hypothetical protein